jgi:hypothetical protein
MMDAKLIIHKLRLSVLAHKLRLSCKKGWFLWGKRVFDGASTADEASKDFTKAPFADSDAASDLATIYTTKPASDAAHAADIDSLGFTKGPSEAVAAADDTLLREGTKSLQTLGLAAEDFDRSIVFARQYADSNTVSDASPKYTTKVFDRGAPYAAHYFAEEYTALEDLLSATEALIFQPTKGFIDLGGFTDAFSRVADYARALDDTAEGLDSLAFEAGKTLSSTPTASDLASPHAHKRPSDSVASAQSIAAFTSNKARSEALTGADSSVFSASKALTNRTSSTDSQAKTTTKPLGQWLGGSLEYALDYFAETYTVTGFAMRATDEISLQLNPA